MPSRKPGFRRPSGQLADGGGRVLPAPGSTPSFPPREPWQEITAAEARTLFRRMFSRWGLPERLRLDNGHPWGSARDLPPELALWLVGLGVVPD